MRTPVCIDLLDHFPGNRPASSNEPLSTQHDYKSVGLHNPSEKSSRIQSN